MSDQSTSFPFDAIEKRSLEGAWCVVRLSIINRRHHAALRGPYTSKRSPMW
jgi:hypothetical protein